jgi:hypothetical protein
MSFPRPRPRSVLVSLPAVASAAALAIATAGCGSGAATLDPIAQAADATTHAGGARMAIRVRVANQAKRESIVLEGSGDFNMGNQEGELLFQLGGTSGIPAAKLKALHGGKLDFTELFAHGSLYMSSPLFDGRLPGGAKWLKVDLSKVASAAGIDVQSLTSGQSDPTQYLQYLRAAGGNVKDVGRDTVRGTPTTHYTGTIDLSREAEKLPTQDRAKLRAAMRKIIAQTGTSKIPVEVWIDAHHLVRRTRMEMSLDIKGKSSDATIDYELFEFGPTPTVNVPSSSEVYDATQLSIARSAGG